MNIKTIFLSILDSSSQSSGRLETWTEMLAWFVLLFSSYFTSLGYLLLFLFHQ
jgi:hypothetical protein